MRALIFLFLSTVLVAGSAAAEKTFIAPATPHITPEINAGLIRLLGSFTQDMQASDLGRVIDAHAGLTVPADRAASAILLRHLLEPWPLQTLSRLPPSGTFELLRQEVQTNAALRGKVMAMRSLIDRDLAETAASPPEPPPYGSSAAKLKDVGRLVKALEAGAWSEPVLEGARALELAQEARERGLIGEDQHVTMFLRWEAFDDVVPTPESRQAIPIVDAAGRLTPPARMIPQTAYPEGVGRYWKEGPSSEELSRQDAAIGERFERLVAGLPASEKVLWVPLPSGNPEGRSPSAVIPFGVLQASLIAQFGQDAVKLSPTDDPESTDEVLSGIGEGKRVFGYSAPWKKPQDHVDRFFSGKLGFSMHDFFHAAQGSTQPAAIRRMFPRIVDVLAAFRERWRHRPIPGLRSLDSIKDGMVDGYWLQPQTLRDPWPGFADALSLQLRIGFLAVEDVIELVLDMARRPDLWFAFDGQAEALRLDELLMHSRFGLGWTRIFRDNQVQASAAPDPAPAL